MLGDRSKELSFFRTINESWDGAQGSIEGATIGHLLVLIVIVDIGDFREKGGNRSGGNSNEG